MATVKEMGLTLLRTKSSSIQPTSHLALRLSTPRVSNIEEDGSTTLELSKAESSPSNAVKKKPADPAVEISRARELDYLLKSGQRRADAAIMGAGFLGGASTISILLWVLFGIGFATYGIFSMLYRVVGVPDASWLSFVISLFAASLIGFLRAYFLYRKMYRNAFWSFVISIYFWAITEIVNLAIRIVQINADKVNAKLFVCSSSLPAVCRGSRLRASKIMQIMFQVFMGLLSLAAINVASNLSKGRFQDASTSMVHTFYFFAFALLSSGIGNMLVLSGFTGIYIVLMSLVFFAGAGYLTRERERSKKKAHAKIKDDLRKYDEAWNSFVHDADNKTINNALRTHLSALQSVLSECEATEKKDLTRASKRFIIDQSEDSAKPLQVFGDLVSLFSQAHQLNKHYQQCVKDWSQGIPGAYPKEAPVKRRARAIEKLYRSYSGDSRKLIDLVRSSIVFDSLESLIAVLKRIRDDERVAILQVKNRLSLEFNSKLSAGYRNVALSLILVDDFTAENDIELHICELQLGLSIIEEIKKDDGHQRYVAWRDLRAE